MFCISAGFDGFQSDPIGGDLGLTLGDYTYITNQVRLCVST
jgi:acetoin utilization deacetylase AcuC-like enzyme